MLFIELYCYLNKDYIVCWSNKYCVQFLSYLLGPRLKSGPLILFPDDNLIQIDQSYSNSTYASLVIQERPLLILSQKFKGQVTGGGSICLPTNFFPDQDEKFRLDLSTVFKLHIRISHHSGKIPIDFGVKRLNIKVTCLVSLHLLTNFFMDDSSCLNYMK